MLLPVLPGSRVKIVLVEDQDAPRGRCARRMGRPGGPRYFGGGVGGGAVGLSSVLSLTAISSILKPRGPLPPW